MGATLTVNQGSSRMVRLVDGQLVEEEAQRNLYVVPPKGEYEFEITGYALPFEMKKSAQFVKAGERNTQTMTRLEFTITNGKGAGRMWSEIFGFSIGPKSNLGNLLRRLRVDLEPDDNGQWDLDRAVGYRGRGYVTHMDKLDEQGKPLYARLSIGTVEPLGAPDRPYSITIDSSAPASNGHNGHHAQSDNDGWA